MNETINKGLCEMQKLNLGVSGRLFFGASDWNLDLKGISGSIVEERSHTIKWTMTIRRVSGAPNYAKLICSGGRLAS